MDDRCRYLPPSHTITNFEVDHSGSYFLHDTHSFVTQSASFHLRMDIRETQARMSGLDKDFPNPYFALRGLTAILLFVRIITQSSECVRCHVGYGKGNKEEYCAYGMVPSDSPLI